MADNSIQQLDDTTFSEVTSSGVVLVDFWAPWCGPCMAQGRVLEQVAEVVGDSAVIAKVNIDRVPQVAADFGIQAIPTLVLLNDGEVVERFVGLQQASVLLAAVGQTG